ncbi:hypothetical protein QN277_006681 [Acacia crassicarpa]|uniref:Oleosin n=1 Tax=Acacia crassicarpa TaxID=499986 RepID=A0AAE1IT37_9FABA|nr:hypothetical protein QN277_006681 [Acacia crassicarpa]
MAETRQYYFRLSPMAETRQHTPPASTSQVLALALLAPLSAFLLFLSAITLTGNVVGIALSTPLFVIFSPVLLPAALLIGSAVAGFLTSAAFGLTSVASFTWMANHLRRARLSEQLEYAKHSAQDTISHAAQSLKETGEGVLRKGHEVQAKAQESRNEAEIEKAQREKDQNEKAQSEKDQREKSQREKRSS